MNLLSESGIGTFQGTIGLYCDQPTYAWLSYNDEVRNHGELELYYPGITFLAEQMVVRYCNVPNIAQTIINMRAVDDLETALSQYSAQDIAVDGVWDETLADHFAAAIMRCQVTDGLRPMEIREENLMDWIVPIMNTGCIVYEAPD